MPRPGLSAKATGSVGRAGSGSIRVFARGFIHPGAARTQQEWAGKPLLFPEIATRGAAREASKNKMAARLLFREI
ncbi:hypothetical protein MRX96_022789 [Rhipicephalus microplus]